MTAPHLFKIRVYYEDTDFSGYVYHASHVRFIERARTEMLRELGLQQRALLAGEAGAGFFFVVRAMELDFRRPALMDDLLTVETRLVAIGGASLTFAQRILRGDEPLALAKVTIAAVENGRAYRLPPEVRTSFETFLCP